MGNAGVADLVGFVKAGQRQRAAQVKEVGADVLLAVVPGSSPNGYWKLAWKPPNFGVVLAIWLLQPVSEGVVAAQPVALNSGSFMCRVSGENVNESPSGLRVGTGGAQLCGAQGHDFLMQRNSSKW